MATYMKGLLLQSLIIRNNLSTIIVLKKEQQGGFKKEPNFGHWSSEQTLNEQRNYKNKNKTKKRLQTINSSAALVISN